MTDISNDEIGFCVECKTPVPMLNVWCKPCHKKVLTTIETDGDRMIMKAQIIELRTELYKCGEIINQLWRIHCQGYDATYDERSVLCKKAKNMLNKLNIKSEYR